MVQGTPQTSDVPPVLGTPSGLNAPAMGQAGAQGVASSSAQAGAEKAALAHGQAGSQGAAPSVGQAAAPSGQAAAPSAPQTIGKQTTPAQSPSPTQPSHFAAPHGQPAAPSGQPAAPHGQAATSSAPRTFVSHSAAPRMASGGIKVAGHISRRAFMLGVAGGAVAVAAGTGAILYLNRPASGGPSPAGSTSGGATSGRSTPAGPSPVPTVKTYFDAINRKDAQTAWDQLSTNYQSQYGSKEAFFRSVAQGSAYDYTLSLTQEDSSTATVVATQVGGSCSGGQDAVPLVIENGVWKIDGLRIAKPCPQ